MELTNADGSQEPHCQLRLVASWKHRLQHVICEGERDDTLRAGPVDQHFDPHAQEAEERAEHLQHVRIVGTGPGDDKAQLGIAECAHQGEQAAAYPHEQRRADASNFLENSGWTHEDAGANDRANDDPDPVHQRDLFLQLDPLLALLRLSLLTGKRRGLGLRFSAARHWYGSGE